eukprot:772342-Prymnesium_polylepis.1
MQYHRAPAPGMRRARGRRRPHPGGRPPRVSHARRALLVRARRAWLVVGGARRRAARARARHCV